MISWGGRALNGHPKSNQNLHQGRQSSGKKQHPHLRRYLCYQGKKKNLPQTACLQVHWIKSYLFNCMVICLLVTNYNLLKCTKTRDRVVYLLWNLIFFFKVNVKITNMSRWTLVGLNQLHYPYIFSEKYNMIHQAFEERLYVHLSLL